MATKQYTGSNRRQNEDLSGDYEVVGPTTFLTVLVSSFVSKLVKMAERARWRVKIKTHTRRLCSLYTPSRSRAHFFFYI